MGTCVVYGCLNKTAEKIIRITFQFTQNHDLHHQSLLSSTSDAGCHGDASFSQKVENIFSAINRPITTTSTEDNRTADISATDPNLVTIRTPILPRRRRPLSWSNPAYTNPNDSQVVDDPERSQDTLTTKERRTSVIGCDDVKARSHSWLGPITSEKTGRKRCYEKEFKKKKRSCISGVKQRISNRMENVENNSTSSVSGEKPGHKRITKRKRKPNSKRCVTEANVDEYRSSDDDTDSDEIPLKLGRTRTFSPSSLLGIKCEADKGTDKDLDKGGSHSTTKHMFLFDCFCKNQSHWRENNKSNISIQASRLLKNLIKDVFEELGNVNTEKDHLIVNKKLNVPQTSGSESSLECKRWKDAGVSSFISIYMSSRDERSEPSLSSASGDAPLGSNEIQKSRDSDKFTSISCSAFDDHKASHQVFSPYFEKRFNHSCTRSLQDISKPELIQLVCKQSTHSDKFVLMKADEEQVSSSSGELFYSFERDSAILNYNVFKSPKAFRSDSPSNIKSITFTTGDEKGENVEPENPTIMWAKRLADASQQENRENILSELLPQSLLVLSKDLKEDLTKFIISLFFDANLIATKERLPVQSTVDEKEENKQKTREGALESSPNMFPSPLKQSEKLLCEASDIEASLDKDSSILRGDALIETKEKNGDAVRFEFEAPANHSRFEKKFRDLSPKKLSHSLRVPLGREGEKPHRIDLSKYKRLIWDEEPEVTEVFDECWEAISYLCDAESVESDITAQFDDDKDALLPERFQPRNKCQGDQTVEMEKDGAQPRRSKG